jgi:mannose-6-phosphate isomerase-like protein (cupin superfamily)
VEPKIVPVTTGEVLEFSDWAAVIKIAADATDGTLTVIVTRHDPGEGASPHIHSRESETFVVMDGRVTFQVGDARYEVEPGGMVFGPPGMAHGFEVGPDGGRLLHLFVPSGMEGYFREMHAAEAAGIRVDFVKIRQQYGMETMNPPLGQQ